VTRPTAPTQQPDDSAPAVRPAGRPVGFERLEGLWSEHSATVFRAAHRVTGNAADAEDVVQTVFLRLARRPDRELHEAAGGYLYRSAVNAALDVVRSRQRAGWVPLESPSGGQEPVSSGPDPERVHRSTELRGQLRLAISRLSPRAGEVFALRYFEGLGNTEIAELLGVSQGVVAVLLHRTRARLQKELVALNGEA
jgi:RNA polymerase sigma-70 factor (ECF subfamily)